jgi:hypothetical protein
LLFIAVSINLKQILEVPSLPHQTRRGGYWLVPSVLSAVIFGLINVWVLLVEILR